MSLQSTTNKLENCNECLTNIATLLCKEYNSILCKNVGIIFIIMI